MSEERTYSIGSLAQTAGVSRRTVRFYVQGGLLAAPAGLGRSAHYTGAHLARLLEIKAWQQQGVPLEEIRARLAAGRGGVEQQRRVPSVDAGAPPPPASWSVSDAGPQLAPDTVPGQGWFRQPLMAGYELHVGAGRTPLSAAGLAQLARHLHDILETGGTQ